MILLRSINRRLTRPRLEAGQLMGGPVQHDHLIRRVYLARRTGVDGPGRQEDDV